ncbi:DUF3500 domain-containing protein [Zobellia amurskyensis]|uniref:DUF3500 domain-containing protein n=1 Tax=Zobellia amurskyensis TaxID=248905 RepID=A0A7X3D2U6_9FLAO|nr:DUF3500 domain-containing protein [Zobellia amurskyensis]MUH37010.1 DUF3500 domain-containing protein [Zobellia amurskyensis]
MRLKKLLLLPFCILAIATGRSQDLHTFAQTFLHTLNADLLEKIQFKISDAERFNFNYVPVARKGPTFNDFNTEQKEAATNLLKASLSQEGFRKASEIMALENILAVLENNERMMPDGTPMRDALNYHFSIFGEPAAGEFWGWRFEGHHVSLNFIASKGAILSATPSFMGSNPGTVPSGESKGKQVLKKETEIGFELLNSLSEKQLAQAIFSNEAPYEIFTRNHRTVSNLEPKGILFADLSEEQKASFQKLLNLYLDNYEARFSKSLKTKIEEAGFNNLSFAWAGSQKPGQGHYYHIQGPTILIEYDNIQNNANHVHTVVRDLTNDFGQDILKDHYDHSH